MKTAVPRARARRLDELALALPQRASALTRLFFARTGTGLSRTEVGLVAALAAREGITQPAVTQLVNRLERRGYAERRADPEDGRAVLVVATGAGRDALERVRAEYR